MPVRLFSAAAFAAVLAACAVEAAPVRQAPVLPPQSAAIAVAPQSVSHEDSVWCDIRITRTRDGLRFAPVAEANTSVDASYRFTLTRIDANGSSDVEQGGDVYLPAYERVTLSSNELSVDPGGRFRARLIMEDRYGVVCRQEVRS